jgi:hypothetical protein
LFILLLAGGIEPAAINNYFLSPSILLVISVIAMAFNFRAAMKNQVEG